MFLFGTHVARRACRVRRRKRARAPHRGRERCVLRRPETAGACLLVGGEAVSTHWPKLYAPSGGVPAHADDGRGVAVKGLKHLERLRIDGYHHLMAAVQHQPVPGPIQCACKWVRVRCPRRRGLSEVCGSAGCWRAKRTAVQRVQAAGDGPRLHRRGGRCASAAGRHGPRRPGVRAKRRWRVRLWHPPPNLTRFRSIKVLPVNLKRLFWFNVSVLY